ncbi:terminase gpA endonuclease subunit [Brevundimonas diminuta]|uniref:terminase gpA endonuclease subunit n=1 Tax=Brevundimonas diminuta TaxID=293 RepID=UPI003D9A7022
MPELLSETSGRLGEDDCWRTIAAEIAPKERLQPLEWGARKRVYTKEGSASRWRPEATPWAAGILHALSDDSPLRRVISPKGTQLGFTELGLITVGSKAEAGESSLMILPSETLAKRAVKTKFRPMIRTTPALAAMFPGRSADTGLHFSSPSADIVFAGSGSASSFAMMSVPFVMGDEIDRWEGDLADEGDPLDLAENRIAEFTLIGKMFVPSSPTTEDGAVWRAWLESDQRYYFCPCPVCGVKQRWLWENMDWEGRDTPESRPETVRLYCTAEGCGVGSTEAEWKGVWQDGEWIATVTNPIRGDTAGFHLSTLYARFGQRTWKQLAEMFQAASRSGKESRLRVFWNTILGLPWKVTEDAIAAEELKARLEPDVHEGLCPEECLLLTAGVDYQKTWVEVWVWGWTRAMRRWPIAKVVIERRTKEGRLRSAEAIAEDLKIEALEKAWPHESGGVLKVEMAIHDSGDHPSLVYDVLEHLPSAKNYASKGVAGWNEQQPARRPKVMDVKSDGKVVAHGRKLMIVHSAEAKREFYEDLRRSREDADGERFIHLGGWLDEPGLLEGMVAEEIRLNSRKKPYWHKIFERNEPLDCAVLARVGHWQLKAHRWAEKEWKAREVMVIAAGDRTDDRPPDPARTGAGGRRIRGRIGR